ncbi:TetR/AcrR family transcriptional regulator [Novosphingobium sp. YJ-S2-02]|uniref:TetR/AcrR family transcriptional regulator n=1 Tax=Novosphingobium aureum TaxID=2792964 RepID=A0A931HFG1_9SPHN|nr:TetR/AcrR family transcriptional regulator [Novosphingobium aureum]MBH0114438.1 TetR/AcrR family transcriptional regulator [Novosphingobium aureum]
MSEAAPSRPRDARARKTLASLRTAMLTLLEDERFEDVTVRALCKEAGIGYATFFRHYTDKDALLSHVAASEIADLIAHAAGLLLNADRKGSTLALCAFIEGHRSLWTTLLTGGAAAMVRTEMLAQARKLAQELTSPTGKVPKDLAVVFGVASVLEVLAWWLQDHPEMTGKEVAPLIEQLAIAPIMPGG